MNRSIDNLPKDIWKALLKLGLLDSNSEIDAEPLSGGVSSDIWRIRRPAGDICVKKALAQLKVEKEWRVSVERNAYEVAWFKVVQAIVPEAIPEILAHDAAADVFVMRYLPAEHYPVWKAQLLNGLVDIDAAKQLGKTLAKIHAGTAFNAAVSERFATDDLFYALRVEPYLLAAAEQNTEVAGPLKVLADTLMRTKMALVHGDISPKNILLGPTGPVILDAECAWYGDPAFDLAFCLNHLLLKCVPCPAVSERLLLCFELMANSYLAEVSWETADECETRVAQLLPALLLARVDGKSPVEYISTDVQRQQIRRYAKFLLLHPVNRLRDIQSLWKKEICIE